MRCFAQPGGISMPGVPLAHLRKGLPRRSVGADEAGGELMRSVLFACAAMWLLMSAPRVDASTMAASSAPTISAPSAVFAVQVPDKKIEVTVDQQRSGG